MVDRPEVEHSIRQNVKRFFLDEVVGKCREKPGWGEVKNFLLVLDDRTSKIVDKFADMTDLVEAGIIGIEKLSAKRKSFKNFHIIYFIDPNAESLNFIKNDFLPGEDRKGPMYDLVHIVFSRWVEELTWKSLGNNKELAYACCNIMIGKVN
jgi:hypothetical protein